MRGFLRLAIVLARESFPFGGGVLFGVQPAGLRHRRRLRRDFGRILRPRQPDLLAAGTPHGAASRAQTGQINGIGR
ncbi:hypothetical protein GALL_533190 [mine drainage metagenome]|uniref:Uncharacterized protein n=1 Tax=mine drainage metagenome TaxID=410659 RepID=A0A1J5P1Y4_9ZZZZ